MKREFPGFFQPSTEEYERAWRDGIIVVDTNVLLNLYRYTRPNRESLLQALTRVGPRLWMPHQVAFEFLARRADVILEQRAVISKIEDDLEEIRKYLNKKWVGHSRNAVVDIDEISALFAQPLTDADVHLNSRRQEFEANYPMTVKEDEVLDNLADLYESRVGQAPNSEAISTLEREAQRRLDEKVPPGYLDNDKSDRRPFGDYKIWQQCMDRCASESSDLIFVTDDIKEDWWWKSEGARVGPRPELTDEFQRLTDRRPLFYSTEAFLSRLSDQGLAEVPVSFADELPDQEDAGQEESPPGHLHERFREIWKQAEIFQNQLNEPRKRKPSSLETSVEQVRVRVDEIRKRELAYLDRASEAPSEEERDEFLKSALAATKRREALQESIAPSLRYLESVSDPAAKEDEPSNRSQSIRRAFLKVLEAVDDAERSSS